VDSVEDHKEWKDFPQGGGVSSVQTRFILRTTESWPSRPRLHAGHWALRWATQREKGGSWLGHKAEGFGHLLGYAQKIEGRKDFTGWASIKVPTHSQ
jgi:hypothetical protein